MNEANYLYRITYRNELEFDDEGYLISHNENSPHDRKSIPLAEEKDLEVVARFFVFTQLLGSNQPFLILKILASDVINRSSRKRFLFEGHEHFGFVHKDAVKSILKGEWIADLEHSLGESFLRHPLGAQILKKTRGLRPQVSSVLSQEEVERLLRKK